MVAGNALETKTEQASWEGVLDLLAAGKYESAATLLEKTEVASSSEADIAVKSILRATREMCLAGNDYQAEAEFHKQAFHTASAREKQLREQLTEILKLIGPPTTLPDSALGHSNASSANEPPKRREIPGLLRRIQDLLGPSQDDETGEDHSAETAAKAPNNSSANPELPAPPKPALPFENPNGATSYARTQRLSQSSEIAPADRSLMLAIYCLGPFRVYQNGTLIKDWTGNKGKSILKYLTLHRDKPVHRDVLVDLFWREDDPESARRNLYQTVYMLRQDLQAAVISAPSPSPAEQSDHPYVLCENSCYLLNPELEIHVDFEAFLTHYEAGQTLERNGRLSEAVREYEAAENCYEGDLFVEDLYEEWAALKREQLKNAYLDALDRVSRYYWSQRQFSLCITYCQKILQADRCREDVHRRLMMVYIQQGHRHLALRQYHRCVEALQQELDATPMPATVELYEEIKNHRL